MSTNIFILKIVDLILFAQLSKGSVKISNPVEQITKIYKQSLA